MGGGGGGCCCRSSCSCYACSCYSHSRWPPHLFSALHPPLLPPPLLLPWRLVLVPLGLRVYARPPFLPFRARSCVLVCSWRRTRHCSRPRCCCHGCWCWCRCRWGCTYMRAHCSFRFVLVHAPLALFVCSFVRTCARSCPLLSPSSCCCRPHGPSHGICIKNMVSVHSVVILLTFKTSTIHLHMKN